MATGRDYPVGSILPAGLADGNRGTGLIIRHLEPILNQVLSQSTVQEKIQEMVRRIVEKFDPDKIILFGSYAQGMAGADSDVDLLVIKPFTGSKRQERIKIGIALQGMGLAKDIIVATPEDVEGAGTISGTQGFHPFYFFSGIQYA